jgi:hypothetical protein
MVAAPKQRRCSETAASVSEPGVPHHSLSVQHQSSGLEIDDGRLGAEPSVPAERNPCELRRLAVADEQAERQRVG